MTSDPTSHRIGGAPRSVLTRIRASIAATCAIAIGGVAALLVGVSNEVSADADAETGTSTSSSLDDTTSSGTTSPGTTASGTTASGTTASGTTSGTTSSAGTTGSSGAGSETSTPTAESSVSADDSDSEPVGGSNGS